MSQPDPTLTEAQHVVAVLQLQMQIVQLQAQVLAYQMRDAQARLAEVTKADGE